MVTNARIVTWLNMCCFFRPGDPTGTGTRRGHLPPAISVIIIRISSILIMANSTEIEPFLLCLIRLNSSSSRKLLQQIGRPRSCLPSFHKMSNYGSEICSLLSALTYNGQVRHLPFSDYPPAKSTEPFAAGEHTFEHRKPSLVSFSEIPPGNEYHSHPEVNPHYFLPLSNPLVMFHGRSHSTGPCLAIIPKCSLSSPLRDR